MSAGRGGETFGRELSAEANATVRVAVLREEPVAAWVGPVADWLEARTGDESVFEERVEAILREGVPDAPLPEALIQLDVAQHSTGAAEASHASG